MKGKRWATAAGAALAVLITATAGAQGPLSAPPSAPDEGTAFVPSPQSEPVYGVSEKIEKYLTAKDGAQLYMESYLPTSTSGHPVPDELPSLLIHSGYMTDVSDPAIGATLGGGKTQTGYNREMAAYFAKRGYAVTIAHARGTAKSDGCNDYLGALERDDIVRVIRYLGRDVSWASGSVGMLGTSYSATAQIAAAGTEGKRTRPYLKAIAPAAPVPSAYAYGAIDGVPLISNSSLNTSGMLLFSEPDSGRPTDRAGCHATEHSQAAPSNISGDFLPWFADREHRRGARQIQVPVLGSAGLIDGNTSPSAWVGLFDHIPTKTPKVLILGQHAHGTPEVADGLTWPRSDYRDMLTAWFDRYLRGAPTGVEDWPRVQEQDSTGQWRTEATWPRGKLLAGQLALGDDGVLGDPDPKGATTVDDDSVHPPASLDNVPGVGNPGVWRTAPLKEALHLTGEPRLELHVVLDQPDAHVTAQLQAFDADGNALLPLISEGRRSARHLDPFVDERFEQARGKPAPVGVPIRIPVRLFPVDVVVPKGGYLRVTVGGVVPNGGGSFPSGAHTHWKVLHDCAHRSVLWLARPSKDSELLNVAEPDDRTPASSPATIEDLDGAGILDGRTCRS